MVKGGDQVEGWLGEHEETQEVRAWLNELVFQDKSYKSIWDSVVVVVSVCIMS